ncbi:SPOSA6832_02119, partial [Sporobolomyces salmonicolor]
MHSTDIPPPLLDYLHDLALPACIYPHRSLLSSARSASDALQPAYQNPALEALLRQGVRSGPGKGQGFTADEGTEERGMRTLVEALVDDEMRQDLRVWLVEGVQAFSSIPNTPTRSPSSSPVPASAHPPPRDRTLQLSTDIAFSKLYWRATVAGSPNDGYTVLTQLPTCDLSMRSAAGASGQTALAAPSAHKEEPAKGKHRIGDLEVDAETVKDPTTLEGMAYTLWNSPVGLFRCNRDLSVTMANPAWRHICGVREGESTDSWASRIHPDDRERVVAHYTRVMSDLTVERDELEFRWRRDGPVMVDGVMEGWCGYLLNINQQKAAATAAELREHQLQSELALLSSTCAVGLARIDLDGHFVTVNQAWYDVARLPKDRPLDQWDQALHPDDRERVLAAWNHALSTLEPMAIQFRWDFGDVCLIQVQPNHSNPKEATGWIGSITNVTAQARAEEAVLNLLKEREASAKQDALDADERRQVAVEEKRQQELLIDVTSHEIRNPNSDFTRSSLQRLLSTMRKLKDRKALPDELSGNPLEDLEEDIEALDAITDCGLAQERIANDILGLAQIQLSKYSITPVEFDLATSLRNICRMFKSECRAKGVELKLVIGSSLARLGPRARVFADPARLTQVLVNLLSNAIRFTAKSDLRRVTLSVEISAKPPDRDSPLMPPHETEYHVDKRKPVYLFFSIEDTGPGMTEDEMAKLFKKFMQASPFTHTTWGGSGLGLWIARNLCELQAGRIEVASTVGQGSIFRCFITARSVDVGLAAHDNRAVPVIEGITAPNAARGEAPRVFLSKAEEENAPLNGMKDNQINRAILKRQLTKEGCGEVILACDGQEGIDTLYERPPGEIDCVLMDIEMPVLDGLRATRTIRLDERQGRRTGHQRIVGLTGNARSAQKQAALDAGMDVVLTKPYKRVSFYPSSCPGVHDLVEKIRDDVVQPASPATPELELHPTPSHSGSCATAAYVPTSRSEPESSFKTPDDATIEVIASSPSSGSSPERTAPEAAQSMKRHGSGKLLPPSQDPEDEPGTS